MPPERLSIAKYQFSEEQLLSSNASNLPAVLAFLQGSRRPVFDKIEKHVVDIMPGIERITVTPSGKNFEILVWPFRETNRRELAFSLEDSGTGVAQLLAIITAIVTSDNSTIIIDEINTFLHPTASKELMRLLSTEYPHHQYIISTHSSEIIGSTRANTVHIVEREAFRSTVRSVDLGDINNIRQVAGLLGFSMMDVFGYERMIWVEGQTEELCFPFLYSKMDIGLPDGLGFQQLPPLRLFRKRPVQRSL